jgi:hypothetical protein
VTAPGKLLQCRHIPGYTATDWIEVDVTDKLKEIGVLLA